MPSGGTNTVSESPDPWVKAQPHLERVFEAGQGLFEDPNSMAPFLGQSYADRNDLQLNARDMQLNSVGGIGDLANAQQGAWMNALNAPDVANNPYVGGMADTISRRMDRDMTQNMIPRIEGGLAADGQLGSRRSGAMMGDAIGRHQEAKGDALANLYGSAYKNGLLVQQGAIGQAPSVMNSQLAPANLMEQVGAMDQSYDQMAIGDQMRIHDALNAQPYEKLNAYNSMLNGIPFGSTSSSERGLGVQDALGAGMLGLNAYNAFGAAGAAGAGLTAGSALPAAAFFGATAPTTAAATTAASFAVPDAMALAFAAPAVSDRKAKKNIKPLGKRGAYEWYEFEYKDPSDGTGKQVGVMADEVEKINPDAVITRPDGMKMVNYGAL